MMFWLGFIVFFIIMIPTACTTGLIVERSVVIDCLAKHEVELAGTRYVCHLEVK